MSREQIVRDTAYAIWEAEGKPVGRNAEHWRQAEERVAASVTGSPDAKFSEPKFSDAKAGKSKAAARKPAATAKPKAT